jgi:hypothetical protein
LAQDALGWMITVQVADNATPIIYNVAVPNEREAIDAVKQVLSGATDAIIKVKSELVERTYKALKMKPGDVMVGARRCRKKAAVDTKRRR